MGAADTAGADRILQYRDVAARLLTKALWCWTKVGVPISSNSMMLRRPAHSASVDEMSRTLESNRPKFCAIQRRGSRHRPDPDQKRMLGRPDSRQQGGARSVRHRDVDYWRVPGRYARA